MRVPALSRHRTGQGVVRIAGKDYYCGLYESPECKRRYELLISEFLANKHSYVAASSGRTVDELILSFSEYAKETYTPAEFNNIRLVMKALLALYGDTKADEFGPVQFKTLREKILSEGNNRSRQYVNKCMRLVVRMFKWCTGEGLVDPKVLATIREIQCLKRGRTTAPESAPVREVPQHIVEATLPHMPQVVADMVRLQQLLGCRPGELCTIKPSMVDRSHQIWEIHLQEHKNAHRGHSRTIFVGPKAQSILKTYLQRPEDCFCFSPREAMEQRREARALARVTPANQGNRRGYSRRTRQGDPEYVYINDFYKTSSYGHAIAYACKLAWPAPEHLDAQQTKAWHASHRWSPNQLRHTAAGEIRSIFGLEHCAAVLGHADVDTSKIYAQLRREKAIEAALTR